MQPDQGQGMRRNKYEVIRQSLRTTDQWSLVHNTYRIIRERLDTTGRAEIGADIDTHMSVIVLVRSTE